MRKPFSFVSLLAATVAMVLTGCQTKQSDYVNLGVSMYTLPSEQSSLTVTVDASGSFAVNSGATWLEVTEQNAESFTLTASENADKAMRNTVVTVTSGSATSQLDIAQMMQDNNYKYRRLSVHGAAISPDGRYIVTNVDEIRDGVEGSLLSLIDTRTEETVTAYYPVYVASMTAVTNDGTAFGTVGSITDYTFDIRTGDYVILPTPEDKGTPMIGNVSGDGTKWAGATAISETYIPTLWTNGTPAYLPIPETDYRGEGYTDRILARGISNDGNIIYGNTWVGLDMGMLYWKDGKVDWVGKDLRKLLTVTLEDGSQRNLVNGMTCSAEQYNTSETGKYIGGTYVEEFDPETEQSLGDNYRSYPAFYNTETETTTVFTEFPGAGGYACRDNGLAVIIPSMSIGVASTLVNIETQEVYGSYQDYILDNYGLLLPAGSVDYISGENLDTFFGMEPGILANWWWYFAPKN